MWLWICLGIGIWYLIGLVSCIYDWTHTFDELTLPDLVGYMAGALGGVITLLLVIGIRKNHVIWRRKK